MKLLLAFVSCFVAAGNFDIVYFSMRTSTNLGDAFAKNNNSIVAEFFFLPNKF